MSRLVPRAALATAAVAMAAMTAGPLAAQEQKPRELSGIGVDEALGRQVPPGLFFKDADGNPVRLGDLFQKSSEKPILLVTAYYDCRMLCSLVLDGVSKAVAGLDWTPGEEYELVTVSFDPEEGPVDAKRKQQQVLSSLGRDVGAEDWPFLTGDPDRIDALLEALGERIEYLDDGEIAHPAVVFVLTPEGRVSRYLYGIQYPTRDLKLALLEASEGKTGSTVDKILMACFHYDPAERKYGLFVTGFLRVGAAVAGLALAGGLVVLWRRDSRQRKGDA